MFWLLYLPSFILLFLAWLIPKYFEYCRVRKLCDRVPAMRVKSILDDAKVFLMQDLGMREITTNGPAAVAFLFRDEGIMSGWASFIPFILLYKAETVEGILSSQVHINKSNEYELLHPWLGSGLITGNGLTWRKHRKILTPAFHFRILEEFLPIVNEQANILVEKLKECVEETWIDLNPLITRCTIDIICETSMGIQLGSQLDREPEYIEAIKCMQESFLWRSGLPWLRPRLIFYALPMGRKYLRSLHIVQKFTRQVVKQRKMEILQSGWKHVDADDDSVDIRKPKGRLAFLDLLLHYHLHDQEMTEQEVQDEVNTFMFAGHDTTAQGITWTLYLLGLHPVVQKKVHEELDSIFGTDRERHCMSEDLKVMKYLECVIKESQRLYPPVPLVGRKMTEDAVVNGYVIPKGTSCVVMISVLHRDKNAFPNPHRFIPERFLPENSKGRNPYAFIPFSAGPRNCIGQRFAMNEEKIIISAILRNFTIKSLDQQDKIEMDGNVILKPRCPIRIRFTQREQV